MTDQNPTKATRAAAARRAGTGGRGSGARGSVAAGAARATGERARRGATPLIGAPPITPAPGSPAAAGDVVDEDPAAPETESRPAHRPRPVITSGVQRKAAKQAGERGRGSSRRQSDRSGSGSSRSRGAAPAAPAAPSGPAAPAGPERPEPASSTRSTPGSRPRRSAKDKRAADDRARPHLRIAPAVDALPAATSQPRSQPPDPTLVDGETSLATPGLEELIAAAISAARLAAQGTGVSAEDVERSIAELLAYLRRRVEGDYVVDDFGYDADFAETILFPLLRPIYRHWFRVETRGVENIPAEGGALVVANHSGTIAIDSLMVQLAIHDEHPQHRVMRALGADLVFQTPFLGTVSRRGGATLATNADADALFARDQLVGVFPEGFKGVGKPFSERYKLQRFGRGGFVSAALKAGVPIIPVSVVGAEEIAPILGNIKILARALGLPYVPVTPTFPWLGPLGLLPLPSKWIIEFGAPITTEQYGSAAAEDPMLVFDLTDQVRETIQQTLYSLLMQRRSVFF